MRTHKLENLENPTAIVQELYWAHRKIFNGTVRPKIFTVPFGEDTRVWNEVCKPFDMLVDLSMEKDLFKIQPSSECHPDKVLVGYRDVKDLLNPRTLSFEEGVSLGMIEEN